jgi:hypothetical protein
VMGCVLSPCIEVASCWALRQGKGRQSRLLTAEDVLRMQKEHDFVHEGQKQVRLLFSCWEFVRPCTAVYIFGALILSGPSLVLPLTGHQGRPGTTGATADESR